MVRRYPRRKRIFVGAEGESERSLAKWLKILCDEQGIYFHFDIAVSNGGDSLTITEHAAYQYRKRTRNRGKFSNGLIFLDSDRLQQDRQSGRDPEPKANSENLKLVYLKPNFEGLLLRLHIGREKQFPTADNAKRNLQKLWQNYRKPASAEELHKRFRIEDIRHAALHDSNLHMDVGETQFMGEEMNLSFHALKKFRRSTGKACRRTFIRTPKCNRTSSSFHVYIIWNGIELKLRLNIQPAGRINQLQNYPGKLYN